MILDDLVLDVGKYMNHHPGGRYFMIQNVGRDISKFFYGAYRLENDSWGRPHTHS